MRDDEAFKPLMNGASAAMVFIDPPYNVAIEDNVSGKGLVKHRDFQMACGEMLEEQFTTFLIEALSQLKAHSRDGAIVFVCMDWWHIGELLTAGRKVFVEFKHLCVWAKDRASQGSFYRSQHELVFVFKNGKAPHINNIQLGQFGRYRTNVWQYPSALSMARSNDEGNLLSLHPTVKPVQMVADAILDVSNRGDVILDSFLGSGTTVIAAERTGRICYGLEIDPHFIDVTLRRWQAFTGKTALHAESKRSFAQLEEEASRG
jgi:DNA modification methylase